MGMSGIEFGFWVCSFQGSQVGQSVVTPTFRVHFYLRQPFNLEPTLKAPTSLRFDACQNLKSEYPDQSNNLKSLCSNLTPRTRSHEAKSFDPRRYQIL